MATKNAKTGQLCSIPEVVPFEFREAHELYTEITMLNLIDSEITYKVSHSLLRSKPISLDCT